MRKLKKTTRSNVYYTLFFLFVVLLFVGSYFGYTSTGSYKKNVVKYFCEYSDNKKNCLCQTRAIRIFGSEKNYEDMVECSKDTDSDCINGIMVRVIQDTNFIMYRDFINQCMGED